MSGRATKLINKAKKLEKKVRRNYSKLAKLQEHEEVSDVEIKKPTIQLKTPVQNASVTAHEQITYNENPSLFTLDEDEPEVEGFTTKAVSIQRVDYSFPYERDYGIELQVPVGIITTSGIRSGDEVAVCSGALEGRSLEVIEILSTTTIRLDDVSTYSTQEQDIPIKFTIN